MDSVEINNSFYSKISIAKKIDFQARFISEHFFGIRPMLPYFKRKSSRFQQKMATLFKSQEPQVISVDELSIDTSSDIIRRNYIKKGRPFVIRNGLSNWEAYQKWDFDFFKENFGNHEVVLSNHQDLGNENGSAEITDLAHIIDGLSSDSKKYARFNPLLDVYPELQKQLDQEWLDKIRRSNLMKHHALFIGNKGTKTNVHCAGNENIFIHIRGTKKWLLWDQRAQYLLNPEVNRGPAKASSYGPYQNELVDLTNAKTPRYEVTCNEGDIIYVPSYLWHHVYNLTPTIGVGNRWLSPARTIANNPMFAFLELFNTKPFLFTTLNLSKGLDFNRILLKSVKK